MMSISIRDNLEHELAARWPVATWRGTRLLLAVSGGADSVAMLRAIVQLSGQEWLKFVDVAHYNHGWRGAASAADESFVRDLCTQLEVNLVVGHEPIVAESDSVKTEEHARLARYAFLTETAYSCGARYVLTGHTAGDRVETLLHNLFRGSGLAGVSAPALARPLDRDLVLVRPLIGCWRQQVEEYLQQLGQAFREDASNADVSYRRNFLRHELLPLLRQAYGASVDQRLSSFSELAEEALLALRSSAAEYLRIVAALRCDGGLVGAKELLWLPALSQLDFPWAVVREGINQAWLERGWKLQGMTREHWQQVRQLMQVEDLPDSTSSLNLPSGIVARREGAWVRIAQVGD